MKTELSIEIKAEKSKELDEKIQKLKYSMVFDYRSRQCKENLLMFIMDV